MRRKLMISSVFAFVVYPAICVMLFVINLFSNRSFSFFGFGLKLEVLENSADIQLFMKPVFFLSFILVFAVVLGINMVYDLLIDKERRIT